MENRKEISHAFFSTNRKLYRKKDIIFLYLFAKTFWQWVISHWIYFVKARSTRFIPRLGGGNTACVQCLIYGAYMKTIQKKCSFIVSRARNEMCCRRLVLDILLCPLTTPTLFSYQVCLFYFFVFLFLSSPCTVCFIFHLVLFVCLSVECSSRKLTSLWWEKLRDNSQLFFF